MEEETVAAPFAASPGMEEEPSSGGVAEAAGQPMQGVRATQNPKASRLPVYLGPQPEQTPSPLRTVLPHLVLNEEPSGGASLPIQAGESLFFPFKKRDLLLPLLYSFFF